MESMEDKVRIRFYYRLYILNYTRMQLHVKYYLAPHPGYAMRKIRSTKLLIIKCLIGFLKIKTPLR